MFPIPGSERTVQLVMIDTIVLAGLTHPTLRNLPPSGPLSVEKAETEWEWIEQTLNSSKADWIIVAGHYPGTFIPQVHIVVYVTFLVTLHQCGLLQSMDQLKCWWPFFALCFRSTM